MSGDVGNLPLGSRVVVRWRLEAPDAATGATLTDAVGTLVEVTADALVVETRGGPVRVARHRVTAAKVVPPRPARRGAAHLAVSVDDLQRVMSPSWGALERDHLGEWELRASEGFTQRGNSVVTAGDPGAPLGRAVDLVEAWYAARGLPAKLVLAGPEGFVPGDDTLGALLLRRGYTEGSRTLVLTASTDRVAAADPGGPDVLVTDAATPEWLATYLTTRSTVPQVSERVVTGSPDHLFAQIRPGGGLAQQLGLREADAAGTTPIAVGRMGIAHGWAGLGAVWTDPAHRGRGLAAHLTAQLAAAARARGLHLVHLQVEHDNDTAIRLYRRLGFDTHSSYVYLTQPARPA